MPIDFLYQTNKRFASALGAIYAAVNVSFSESADSFEAIEDSFAARSLSISASAAAFAALTF